MPEVSEESKGIFSRIMGLFRGGEAKDSIGKSSSSTQILSGIYKMLIQRETQRELDYKQGKKSGKEEESELEERHREILKALTIKRPVKKQIEKKIEKAKEEKPAGEPAKTTETPSKAVETPSKAPEIPPKTVETPKVETPKVETTKPKATRTPAPKPTVTPAPAPPVSSLPTATKAVTGAVVGAGLFSASTNLIAKEEGVSKDKKTGKVTAYWDPKNQRNLVSIGYGHQIQKEEYQQGYIMAGDEKVPIVGEKGIDTKMTMEQAKKLLNVDVPKYEERAKKPLGDSWNKLSDEQRSALVSYAYNTGSTSKIGRAHV